MFDAQQDDKPDTTSSEGSTSSGYSVAGMTLYLACRSYAKRGTREEFERITQRVIREYWNEEVTYDDAEAKPAVSDKDHKYTASASSPVTKHQFRSTDAGLTNDDGEAACCLPDQGQKEHALPSSPQASGGGQKSRAQGSDAQGQSRPASPARPPIKPNPARGLTSIASIQPVIEKGLLEMRKTHDGRVWGSVGWHELDGMDHDGVIARLIKQKANPPKDKYAELRAVLTNKQFGEILDAAKEQRD